MAKNGNSKLIIIIAIVVGAAAMAVVAVFAGQDVDPAGAPGNTAVPSESSSHEIGDRVQIGSILPITGDLSTHGFESKVMVELAVEDFNAYLDENTDVGWELDITVEDTGSNPVNALEKLSSLNAKNVKIVVGPPSSAEVRNIKGYADTNGMLLISPSSTAPSLAIPGDNVYRLIPDDTKQGPAIATLFADRGIEVVIPVWRGDAWGDGLVETTRASFTGMGGTMDEGIRYNPESSEFSVSVSVLDERVTEYSERYGADRVGVLIISFAEVLPLMQSASEHEILDEVTWFGTDGNTQEQKLIDDPTALEFSQTVQFTTTQVAFSDNLIRESVKQRVMDKLGRIPNSYTFSSYDAVWLAGLSILEAGNTDVADLKAALPAVASEYSGAIGSTTLNEAGDLATADYEIWTIRDGQWLVSDRYVTDTGEIIPIISEYAGMDDSMHVVASVPDDRVQIPHEDVLCDSKNENVVNRLNQIISISEDVGYMCEGVPFGSASGFADFSKYMQNLDDVLLLQGTDPIEINSEIRGYFDQVESSCYDHQDDVLEDILTKAQFKYGMMGLCLDDMYLEFGDFPAMNIGLSPEYITGHSSKSKNSDTMREIYTSKISNIDVLCDSKNENVVNQLNLISSVSDSFGAMCENVPFGSTSGFADFSKDMQNINDGLLIMGIVPIEFNSEIREFFDQVEASCYETNDGALEDVLTKAQFKYGMMGACFDDMYLEFGDFPAMNIGLSPEYTTKPN